MAGLLISANYYRLPPRYKSDLERPPFDASKARTVKADCCVTAAAVATRSAVRLPTKVPTPARIAACAVVGRKEGGHGDGLMFRVGREPLLSPSLYPGQ